MTRTRTPGTTLTAGVTALTIVLAGLFGGGAARADSPSGGDGSGSAGKAPSGLQSVAGDPIGGSQNVPAPGEATIGPAVPRTTTRFFKGQNYSMGKPGQIGVFHTPPTVNFDPDSFPGAGTVGLWSDNRVSTLDPSLNSGPAKNLGDGILGFFSVTGSVLHEARVSSATPTSITNYDDGWQSVTYKLDYQERTYTAVQLAGGGLQVFERTSGWKDISYEDLDREQTEGTPIPKLEVRPAAETIGFTAPEDVKPKPIQNMSDIDFVGIFGAVALDILKAVGQNTGSHNNSPSPANPNPSPANPGLCFGGGLYTGTCADVGNNGGPGDSHSN